MPVAVLGNGQTIDVLHHKIGAPVLSGVGIMNTRYVWMIQQSQGLAFGLEAGHHAFGIHTRLNHLQGHTAFDRLLLFGQVHDPHATLAQDLEQLIPSDLVAVLFEDGVQRGGGPGSSICFVRLSQGVEDQPVQAIGSSAKH